MKKVTFLLTAITLFFSSSTSTFSMTEFITDGYPQKDRNTLQAIELTKKLANPYNNDKDRNNILGSLRKLVSENPDNYLIRNMFTNNLIAEKHYHEGLENLKYLNGKKLTRTNLLTQCMLLERLGNRDENCYREVIALSEKEKIVDSDYLSALFFARDERFEKLKKTLIEEKTFNESDLLSFTLGTEKMLHEFFP